MTMITPSYLGETIEYSSLHACRSTLEDPTFDHPVVHDMYDLGVPRDSKLVDRRPTSALKERLDALDRRIEARTGDGATIVTTVAVAQGNGNDGLVLDTLEIYAQLNGRWAWAQYLVGRQAGRDAVGNRNQRPQLAPPTGWPNLEPKAALELAKNVQPYDLFVHDGARKFRSFRGRRSSGEQASVQDAAYFGVPGWYWPGRFPLSVYSPFSKAALRQEANGDETIIVDAMDQTGTRRWASREVTLGAATGLPAAAAVRIFDDKGVERRDEHWRFLSNLKTPVGVWLPGRWTYEFRVAAAKDQPIQKESILRFDPNVGPLESWLEALKKRAETR